MGSRYKKGAGLDGAELPTLAWAQGVDPATTILVKPASSS